ncbi:MAG: 1-acyl-sn-glycerol-3-phosphate acyltransferase [Chloroflexi bacterium]|nr:MAG: 1-acyl-sn-glycerol-3-phosphate acyltransferase [Chloroflexota bacterium]
MSDWFFRPGSHITGKLAGLFGGAQIIGLHHIPRSGPFILVANHCSQADPPLLGWATGYQTGRVIHFMAKIEMRHWPVVGWLAAQSGVFFIRRGESDRAAQRLALGLLADGDAIAVFPEGTRSRDGKLQAGRPGAALLALRSGAPLVPVGIAGTHRLFASGRGPRRSRMTIRIGPPLGLGHQPDGRLDRRALAEGTSRMMAAIAALLPVAQRGARGGVADPVAARAEDRESDVPPEAR